MSKEIVLGNKIEDMVSGLTGIAIARVEYLNGCVQFALRPKIKKGENKFPEATYFDESQLKIVSVGLVVKKKKTGGPSNHTPPGSFGM